MLHHGTKRDLNDSELPSIEVREFDDVEISWACVLKAEPDPAAVTSAAIECRARSGTAVPRSKGVSEATLRLLQCRCVRLRSL